MGGGAAKSQAVRPSPASPVRAVAITRPSVVPAGHAIKLLVVGPAGSGKSTLVRMAASIFRGDTMPPATSTTASAAPTVSPNKAASPVISVRPAAPTATGAGSDEPYAWTADERRAWRTSIAQVIISAMETLCGTPSTPPLVPPVAPPRESRSSILARALAARAPANPLDSQFGKSLALLWNDAELQRVVATSGGVRFANAKYFMDKIEIVCSPDYVPSPDDYVRCPLPSRGSPVVSGGGGPGHRESMTVNGTHVVALDMPGDRGHRKAWIQGFDSVTAFVFVISLAEWDVRDEVRGQWAWHDALELITGLLALPWFRRVPVFVILTHADELNAKIDAIPAIPSSNVTMGRVTRAMRDGPFPDYPIDSAANCAQAVIDFFTAQIFRRDCRGTASASPLTSHRKLPTHSAHDSSGTGASPATGGGVPVAEAGAWLSVRVCSPLDPFAVRPLFQEITRTIQSFPAGSLSFESIATQHA